MTFNVQIEFGLLGLAGARSFDLAHFPSLGETAL
jgi:hypothetical protein